MRRDQGLFRPLCVIAVYPINTQSLRLIGRASEVARESRDL